jgi:hypothetical protein
MLTMIASYLFQISFKVYCPILFMVNRNLNKRELSQKLGLTSPLIDLNLGWSNLKQTKKTICLFRLYAQKALKYNNSKVQKIYLAKIKLSVFIISHLAKINFI